MILPEKRKSNRSKSLVKDLTLDTGLIGCGFTFGNRFRDFYAEQTGVRPFKFNVDMVASAKAVKENGVYPLSIAEGFQEGKIFYSGDLKTALFWHYCGFAYLSGSVGDLFLEKIYQDYYVKTLDRRFVLITDNSKVIDYFSYKDEVVIDRRIEYRFGNLLQRAPECRYKVEPISAFNYDRIHGNIIPTFSWSDKEQFLKNGFGFVALDGDKVIAVAFSAAVSSDEVDIGVETDENYRHQGLAKVVTDRMCREIISQGKKPVWAHAIANEGSKYTALGVGFVEDKVNMVIMRKIGRYNKSKNEG